MKRRIPQEKGVAKAAYRWYWPVWCNESVGEVIEVDTQLVHICQAKQERRL